MGTPMDERRRRAYLRAMGIDLWVPRISAVPEALPRARSEDRPAASQLPDNLPRPALSNERESTGSDFPSADSELPPWLSESPPDWGRESDIAWGPDDASRHVMPLEHEPNANAARSSSLERSTPADPLADLLPAIEPLALGWDELAAAVARCRACALWQGRTQTVFGVGNREAELMLVGEAPGADEDREGEPFVGRAGRLLNLMLAAIGLKREQVFIANILKCRPPGNRDPRPEEAAHCLGYLERQIALVRPRIVLTLGRISAQTLLGTETPVGRLRGRWLAYGPEDIPVRVTYHPAYLLRSPDQKSKAWEDLTQVALRLASGDRTRSARFGDRQ